MDKMKKKILEAFMRDGYEEQKATPLNEVKSYGWEYDTLEDELAHVECERMDEGFSGDQTEQYELGDVIMTPSFYSPSAGKVIRAPHRIIVITSKAEEDGIINYSGFELSSKYEKSNKEGRYSNNLYIKDYGTILKKGPRVDKQAIVRVDDIVKFSNNDLSKSGSYKGTVSDEFLNFLQTGYNNYRSGKSNKELTWEV